MAKRCMVNREIKREKLVKKYAGKRAELKKQMLDMSLSFEERQEAAKKVSCVAKKLKCSSHEKSLQHNWPSSWLLPQVRSV